ncbi:hypothetical protein U0070_012789 [Myodes glareolus]|uniref:Uncharacterized protein n=1 Tax=Myodes glareolus TaxID=447135 RepID=A0AAW0I875_MYOGA
MTTVCSKLFRVMKSQKSGTQRLYLNKPTKKLLFPKSTARQEVKTSQKTEEEEEIEGEKETV